MTRLPHPLACSWVGKDFRQPDVGLASNQILPFITFAVLLGRRGRRTRPLTSIPRSTSRTKLCDRALEPGKGRRVLQAIADGAERMTAVRLSLRRLCERTLPSLALRAYNGITPRTEVRAVGQIAV
jgi:hypothetical protein